MTTFNRNTISYDHFVPQGFVYPPRPGIKVEAFQVTDDNIGALAVDFESEIDYGVEEDGDLPCFTIRAERWKDENDNKITVRELDVYLSDWIVFMRGMIFVFKGKHFAATFGREGLPARGLEQTRVDWIQEEMEQTPPRGAKVNDLIHYGSGGDGSTVPPTPHPRFQKDEHVFVDYLGMPGVVDAIREQDGAVRVRFGNGNEDWFQPRDVQRLDAVNEPPVDFPKGTKVTSGDNNEDQGEVMDGPNEKDQYFIKYDQGGASWVHASVMRAAQQGQ